MSDSSSFREIAQEATKEVETTVQEVKPEEKAQEAAQVKPKQEEQQESFTDPVDEKALEAMTPQQLLEMRKNWERAYTAKRQKETAELREYQKRIADLEAKAQTQTAQQPTVEQKTQVAREQVELGNMTVEQYTAYVQELMAEKAREIAREEYSTLQGEQQEQTLRERAIEDFSSSDERLNKDHPNFNESYSAEVQREVAELLDKHLEEHGTYRGFDTKGITKKIIERRDAEIDNIIKTRTQQSTQAAMMREAKMRKAEVRGTSSDGQRVGGGDIRSILNETLDGA